MGPLTFPVWCLQSDVPEAAVPALQVRLAHLHWPLPSHPSMLRCQHWTCHTFPQVLACPPQACLDSPSGCSLDDRFIAKGVAGCLDTTAEVGWMWELSGPLSVAPCLQGWLPFK